MSRYEEIDREVIRGLVMLMVLVAGIVVADVFSGAVGFTMVLVGVGGVAAAFWRLDKLGRRL